MKNHFISQASTKSKKNALKIASFDEKIVMKINHSMRCFCYHCEMPVKTNVSATESRCVKGRFNKRRTSKLQASPSFSDRSERKQVPNKDQNRTPNAMDTKKKSTHEGKTRTCSVG